MDCEKFEASMMDELYGELDELTSAAAARHMAGCARCAGLLEGFRATRRVAALPFVEAPPDLEERILAAVAAVRPAPIAEPLGRRLARAISIAGSWAMRPQTAMAAVFLVMIGTSVLLLRGKSSRAPATAGVTVTEQGSPAPATPAATAHAPTGSLEPAASAAVAAAPVIEARPSAPAAAAAAPSPPPESEVAVEEARGRGTAHDLYPSVAPRRDEAASGGPPPASKAARALEAPSPLAGAAAQSGIAGAGGADGTSAFDGARRAYQAGRFDEATHAFDALAPGDPNAELWAARSVREGTGCRASVARFDRVARRAAATPTGWDALLEGALCYRAMGDAGNARVRLNALLNVDSYKDRARAELDRLNQMGQAQGDGPSSVAKGTAVRAAPAPARPKPTVSVDMSQ